MMEDLARSAFMESFYGDMGSWLLASLCFLPRGSTGKWWSCRHGERNMNEIQFAVVVFIVEFLWIWLFEI